MARLTIRTRPTIAMPGFTIPPGITVRPELVLRTGRRGHRGRRRTNVEARLGELLARAERPARGVEPRLAARLGELLARAERPGRASIAARGPARRAPRPRRAARRGVDPRLAARLGELLARAERPRRGVDPRLAARLGELLARAERPARGVEPRLSRLLAVRPAVRPAPVEPTRLARDPRIPVIVALLAGVTAVVLVVAILVRRRASAAASPAPEADDAVAAVVAAPPPVRTSPAWLRRFVTHRFNPAVVRLGLVGGRWSPWAYLEHVGRTTGMAYRTPVLPRIAGDYACVPLPYGIDVSWARNVKAAGHCRLQVRGMVYELDEPAVITAAEHPDLPEAFRGWLIRRGNRYLRLHVLSATPGSLDGSARPAEPVPPVDMVPVQEPGAATRAADTPTVEPG